MNINLIEGYISNLKKEDIYKFALKQGITLDYDEVEIIYNYIKENYKKIIYGNSFEVLLDAKEKMKSDTYKKMEEFYFKFKNKIEIFKKSIR